MSSTRTILVFWGEALAAPEACYSLVDGGFNVVVACRRGSSCSLRKSRLVETREISVPEVDYEKTISELCELAQQINAVAILPIDDTSLWIANHARDQLSCPVAIAGTDAVNVALDKRLQIDAARDAGFAIPVTGTSEGASITEDWHSYPCILKGALATRPCGSGLGRPGMFFCNDAAAIEDAVGSLDPSEPMVLQEWKTGSGVGVFGFRTDDGIQAWSGHHRIRMMNPAGSGSSCCESEYPSENTQACVERMLKSIGWNGLFMIELLRDSDGTEWFMELNGRAWGSMALTRASGLEYPLWAVLNALNELQRLPETTGLEVRRARHLGRELVHLLFVLRGRKRGDGMPWPKRMQTIKALCSRKSSDRWYNARRGDMKVFYADVIGCIRSRIFRGNQT